MVVKYKLGEVAKDFNKSAKDITDLLLKFFEEPKKNQSALENKELDIIFDVLTQENQVESFNEYFAMQKPAKRKQKLKKKKRNLKRLRKLKKKIKSRKQRKLLKRKRKPKLPQNRIKI